MTSVTRLPLFPLDTVLFPGMLLSIHVFEARYLQMVTYCEAEHVPFGVVLTREGTGVGEFGMPHAVGTEARIIQKEKAEDGTLDIIVVGRDRFRVGEVVHQRPYPVAKTEAYPLRGVYEPAVKALSQRVRKDLLAYMKVLREASGTVVEFDELPEEPDILAWVVALTVQIPSHERQQLLECEDLPTLFRKELTLLSIEQKLLAYIARTQKDKDDWDLAPFLHWSPN
jgi:Lon protease-like protein